MARRLAFPTVALAALLLAACGGDGGDDQPGAGEPGTASGATVSTAENETFGTILVDASGAALYTAEQEADGTVRCEGGCAEMWFPLTVGDGETPTGSGDVAGSLATVERSDGTTQVTLDGVPLYTFRLDGAAGEVTGEGLSDAFDGTTFTWHVATASGATATADPSGGFRY